MKHAARLVLLIMLLATLPLRGYAGVLTALCGPGHGGAAVAEEHVHEHGGSQHHDDDSSTSLSQVASVCSICASCCASASLASEATRVAVSQSPGTSRIPFFDRRVSGFVPEHFDRPPLVL